jgi:cyanophycin synthetase
MEFRKIRALLGPNSWACWPVLEVVVDLSSLKGRPLDAFPGFAERLHHRLPTLGGVEEPDPARALGLATLELQVLAGSPVSFVAERPTDEPGVVRVAIEFEEEAIARVALESARDLCLAALDDLPFDLDEEVARLSEIASDIRLGPSTRAIVEAARDRGIPTRRLDPSSSLVLLGQGSKQRRIKTAETDATGALAESIAQDKDLTKILLQAAGVPIPEGRPVEDADDAWLAAQEVGGPVVVKPLDGNHGRGVATDLTTREQVVAAYAAAKAEGSRILVERFIKGDDYRLLVVGRRLVAAARRDPAHVVGDGVSTVARLVEVVNRDPRRGEGHSSSLTKIRLDDPIARAVLDEQGFTSDSVLPPCCRVMIRRNANLSTGGTAEDVTDRVHPDLAARAVEAARVIGLDIAGVDLVAEGVDRPLEQSGGAVVEVNAGPGLRMHLEPSTGTPRPVGREIVAMLFPEGHNGRIPIVAVFGTKGDSTAPQLIARVLADSGLRVGLAGSGGTFVGGRRIESSDGTGPEAARAVLLNPVVDAAVLELDRERILYEGLGFDRCDVAVVTDLGQADAGRMIVEAVAPGGSLVLNAADPKALAMAEHARAAIVFFSINPANSVLLDHARVGGRTVFERAGSLILAVAGKEIARLELSRFGTDRVEDSLAAAATAWCLGIEPR